VASISTTALQSMVSDASILVGDFLISRAILLLAGDCDARIIRAIAEATRILVEGGILEYTRARDIKVDEDHCLDVIYRKTASIISVSCELGALLAQADEESISALISFGNDFGIAFQLVDDAMDYDGDEEVLGKPPGTDFKEGHVTLPLLHLYQNSDRAMKKHIQACIENENLTSKDLEIILDRMRATKSIEYTLDLAKTYIDRGKATLKKTNFASPEYVDAMLAVTDYTLERFTAVRP
jgi:octaprenyl-diphosphate synthase